MLKTEDTINSPVEIWGSADIDGNISGGLEAGGSVNCGNVSGGLEAGGGVNCGNVSGGLEAGNSVNCGDVDGDIESNGGDIHCHEVTGSVNGARIVYIK